MVSGAYFVAMSDRLGSSAPFSIVEQLKADTQLSQDQGSLPISKDSLSPIAQHLTQSDLPRIVWPFAQAVDRGTVLENQWPTINRTFADLRQGEIAGKRASIIVPPMIVETGQPLLISNLDLGKLRGDYTSEAWSFSACSPMRARRSN